jgi:DNA gyrase/topoisomerase IV subunit A
MKTSSIRTIGRSTQGVRLIDLASDDKVVSVTRFVEKVAVEEDNSG